MDQTALPFCFTEGATYADKGEKNVWVRGGASGLEKRQCTVQVTIFADGQPGVKLLIIFKGTGKQITLYERVSLYFSHLNMNLQTDFFSHAGTLRSKS